MTSTRTIALATLGTAALCWVVAVQQMLGMDMGTQTSLGSLSFFLAVWAAMMAAMMLPGALPALARQAYAAPVFAASYVERTIASSSSSVPMFWTKDLSTLSTSTGSCLR